MPATSWKTVTRLLVVIVLGAAIFAGIQLRVGTTPSVDGQFVAIQDDHWQAQDTLPTPFASASTGSFTSECGRNEIGHRNHDNLVSAPGTPGGAHHMHDYVGNLSTNAFSTDTTLSSAATTCTNEDASVYFWPVLRLTTTGGSEGGHALPDPAQPAAVLVRYQGNPTSATVPMPRYLRIITGDPRAATSSTPTAVAHWSCSGTSDRFTTKYPLCPPGQQVGRTFNFPSCWDGRRTDSPNHQTHIVFPARDGSCPGDTFPIPQLHLRVTYNVPPGQTYLIDSFPDQLHAPSTDHADFINVMPEPLMARAVDCINTGQQCGP